MSMDSTGEVTVGVVVGIDADDELGERGETSDIVAEEDVVTDVDIEEDVLVLEEVQAPLELPVWEPTGVAGVDEVLEGLVQLDPDDVHQHADVYTQLHQGLRDVLSDLDSSA